MRWAHLDSRAPYSVQTGHQGHLQTHLRGCAGVRGCEGLSGGVAGWLWSARGRTVWVAGGCGSSCTLRWCSRSSKHEAASLPRPASASVLMAQLACSLSSKLPGSGSGSRADSVELAISTLYVCMFSHTLVESSQRSISTARELFRRGGHATQVFGGPIIFGGQGPQHWAKAQ